MFVQIVTHTPLWVYALLVGLVVLGLSQTRPRTVGKVPALLLPAGMTVFSLVGIHSSFGFQALPLAAWGAAWAVSTWVGYAWFTDERIHYKAEDGRFFFPGSWVPLAVMMALFFAKYGYAVVRAMQAPFIFTPVFVGVLSAFYGLLSGYFSARAVHLVKQAA